MPSQEILSPNKKTLEVTPIDPVLSIRNLSVSFAKKRILHNVSLEIPSRGIHVFLGRSGSGKTTFLRAINRLNEELAPCHTEGEILFYSQNNSESSVSSLSSMSLDYGKSSESAKAFMSEKYLASGESFASGESSASGKLVDSMAENIYQMPSSALPRLRQRIGMLFQSPSVLPTSIWRNLELPLTVIAQYPSKKVKDFKNTQELQNIANDIKRKKGKEFLGGKDATRIKEDKETTKTTNAMNATNNKNAKDIKSRIIQTLMDCALWEDVKERLDSPALSLSGGQQQRLCLARALALHAEILLLDEPTASLDVHATKQIEDLLLQLGKNLPLLVVSHSPEQAHRLADTIHFFHNGRIVETLHNAKEASLEDITALLNQNSFVK